MASPELSNFLRKSLKNGVVNGLLMIFGASTCEVGMVYVGITSHLLTGLGALVCTFLNHFTKCCALKTEPTDKE